MTTNFNPAIKDELKGLLPKLWNQYNLKEGELALYDAFTILNFNGNIDTEESFIDCKLILQEIACLLTDPKISSKLLTEHSKENAGKVLYNLIDFFTRIVDMDTLKMYLFYTRLKHFHSSVTEETLEDIRETFLSNEN